MENAFFAWSGGKDSALALYRVLAQGHYCVRYLLTTVNEANKRVSMHGVRLALLEQQAQAIGIPLKVVWVPENSNMEIYAARMAEALLAFKAEGINHAIFGDIFLADLRKYREEQVSHLNMTAVFPLWGENTTDLVNEFIRLGFGAQLVCVSERRLGNTFINRTLNHDLLQALPPEVDPAGENGEYHTFVYDGPLFSQPISISEGEIILRDYAVSQKVHTENKSEAEAVNPNPQNTQPAIDSSFWFADLIPAAPFKIIK